MPKVPLWVAVALYSVAFLFNVIGLSTQKWVHFKEEGAGDTLKGRQGLWRSHFSAAGEDDDSEVDCDDIGDNACASLRFTQMFAIVSFVLVLGVCVLTVWAAVSGSRAPAFVQEKTPQVTLGIASSVIGYSAAIAYVKYKDRIGDMGNSVDLNYGYSYEIWLAAASFALIAALVQQVLVVMPAGSTGGGTLNDHIVDPAFSDTMHHTDIDTEFRDTGGD